MSASQSNLSDPKYGYDLVVAVTQASINATLKQLLAGLDAPEVTICYVYDEKDNLVPIDYESFKTNAKGSDPFNVKDGTDPKNQDMINLSDANFAGAVKAQLGLPDGLLPSEIPPIATLGSGSNAPVLFNLLCAKFQITGFHYGPRNKTTWINQSQPSGKPWYFSAHVNLNREIIDQKQNSSLPSAVKQKITELQKDPNHAFTIQKLFLDIATAVLESSPKVEGIPDGWPVWSLINSIFIGAYFKQLGQNGDPVLNYHFTVAAPKKETLQLGSVARECLLLKQNGNDIPNPTPAQLNATQLIYIGSTSTTPPVPVPFAWNWIELNEVNQFSGVMAVRREIFLAFLIEMLNEKIAMLCIDTNFSATKAYGEPLILSYSNTQSENPKLFQRVSPSKQPDSFTMLFDISFSHESHAETSWTTGGQYSTLTKYKGDFNYQLTGNVAVHSNNIRIQFHPQVYMSLSCNPNYTPISPSFLDELVGKNYYDKILTATFEINVDQSGQINVTKPSWSVTNDLSAKLEYHSVNPFDQGTKLQQGLETIVNHIGKNIAELADKYSQYLQNELNGYNGWVFPGNDAFLFKNLSFSDNLDIIAQLTYANPN